MTWWKTNSGFQHIPSANIPEVFTCLFLPHAKASFISLSSWFKRTAGGSAHTSGKMNCSTGLYHNLFTCTPQLGGLKRALKRASCEQQKRKKNQTTLKVLRDYANLDHLSYNGRRLTDCTKLSESFILTTVSDSTEFKYWVDTVEAINNGTKVQVQLKSNQQNTSLGTLRLVFVYRLPAFCLNSWLLLIALKD